MISTRSASSGSVTRGSGPSGTGSGVHPANAVNTGITMESTRPIIAGQASTAAVPCAALNRGIVALGSRAHFAAFALVLGLTTACSPEPDPEPEPGWALVFENLDPALLSVWGSAHDDVWTVGADAGDGPMVLHFDGTDWTRLATNQSGNLWWVAGR